MTTAVQRRRGTAAQHTTFTGLAGELTVDTDDNRVVVHDGSTAGGHPAAKESELAAKAPLASPTFTGTPAAPTAAQGTDTTQLATTAFVRAEVAALTDSAPAALDTLNELAAALGDDANFATTMTNALALKAPLANPTFTGTPAGPTAAAATNTTQFATTAFVQQELASAGVGTAQSRNRLVNPAMQISLVNGDAAGTATGYEAANGWKKYHDSSAGTLTAQRVQSVTPNGSKDRFRVTITAADASLAAGEYLLVRQSIEGNEVADLMWGSASAVDIVVRFGFKGPQGTYGVAVGNSATNRSYVTTFTIGAPDDDTDTEVEVVIPGDTTGTWLKDTGVGLMLNIVLAAGSTFQTTADAWQAGNYFGTSGMSNGMGTISDVFEIFDVGLHADPDSTGAAPAWVAPVIDMASRADQEAAASISRFATPATQQYHPSAAKCWAHVTYSAGVPTLQASHNVTSITDSSVGALTITIAEDFSSANWVPVVSVRDAAAFRVINVAVQAAGSIQINTGTLAGGGVDVDAMSFAGFGDI